MGSQDDQMHVVAAVFPIADLAIAAQHDLQGILDVGDSDMDVGAVGGDAGSGNGTLLAGRFRAGRLDDVLEVVERHEGRVLVDVPEAWTGAGH